MGETWSPIHSLADKLQLHVSNLLASRKYSDLTLHSNISCWSVHMLVLCAHSAFFETTCNALFTEEESAEIDLEDKDEWVLEAMTQALYHGEYQIPEKHDENHKYMLLSDAHQSLKLEGWQEHCSDASLTFHAKVYAMADQYDIPWLKELARSKFKVCLDGDLEPKELADAIELVYSTSFDSIRGLRPLVLTEAARRSTKLLRDPDFAAMSRRTGDFSMELAKRLAPKPAKKSNRMCSHCGKPEHLDNTCWRLYPELNPNRIS